jgi:hypothetical protein
MIRKAKNSDCKYIAKLLSTFSDEVYDKTGAKINGDKKVIKKLLNKVITLAKTENKTRIELTTPPLPSFQRSLDFYIKNGFEIAGGKKVKFEIII